MESIIHKDRPKGVHPGRSPLLEPGAILLISCYELGHQPIGLAQPIGFLEQAGYAPAAMDMAVDDFHPSQVAKVRFAGISVPMHTALRIGVRVAELIREVNQSCHICFYGLYASINAEYLLSRFADSVIGGEYEMPLLELVQALDRDMSSSDRQRQAPTEAEPAIEGVSRPGHIAAPALIRMPTNAPVPSRRLLPVLNRYARLERDGAQHVAGYVEASRGCLHHCRHCPIVPVYHGRFFLMPVDLVLQDIRQQIAAGATHITFGDPDFLNDAVHSLTIVRRMHREFPHVSFDCTAKIEHLLRRRSMMSELASLGCLFVISAVESFSDTVLDHLKKGHTRHDVLVALEILRSAGLALRPSLVAFTPWTTLGDYLEMLDIVETLDLIDAIDPVHYSVRLLVPPGSALLDDSGHADSIVRYLGPLDQPAFQYPWAHPDVRMDRLHHEVSAAVEDAAKVDEDAVVTFQRVRDLAYRIAGCEPPARIAQRSERRRAPRLTESWFCCAEPTKQQMVPLGSNP